TKPSRPIFLNHIHPHFSSSVFHPCSICGFSLPFSARINFLCLFAFFVAISPVRDPSLFIRVIRLIRGFLSALNYSPMPSKPDIEAHSLHGTHPEEQDRLGLMNRLLNQNSLAEMQLKPGEKVLDVGSGLGQLTREMARQIGEGAKVVGIERSHEQLTV